jgi:toxin secretion/phage lysis holin
MPSSFTKADMTAGIVASLVAWWTNVPLVMQAIVYLTLIDYITGLGKAIINKDLSSQAGYRGAIRKGMAFMLIAASWVAHNKLGVPVPLDLIVAGFFCGSELISIVENCKQAGLSVPDSLTKYFNALNQGGKDANK